MLCKKKVILQDIFIKANYKRYLMEDSHNKEIETNNPIEQPAKELTSESEENYIQKVYHIRDMFSNWFLDYASYVNLDRAIPHLEDGLKPVQRRILHSMWELEDGRYNKVANIVGNTMKYHPHGDASIEEALVNLGQKNLLIDCQGNWGNIFTGDKAAAARYIEARLSKFALEVAYNEKTTAWKSSYDIRNKEPICLPIKFPLLLAQGTSGIGVGLNSIILPHNFNELLDASIAILQNKDFEIYPDFPTGGYIDVNDYRNGAKRGKVKIRAKIEQIDKKTLAITEIPYTTTTSQLIDNIEKAIKKGRIPIVKIFDRTADKVEILLTLAANASVDQTIDALYAFTNCQLAISPAACVIEDDKPIFTDVKYILRANTFNTKKLLQKELEIQWQELADQWHWISLEKLFFEKRIYKELEKDDQESFEAQLENIERAFDPYRSMFKQEITHDNVVKLTEKPVRKISKFDIKEAEEKLAGIEMYMDEVENNLAHLTDYTINYFKQIKKKFGVGRERKTEIRNFDNISVPTVAVANQKLYIDRTNGFIGTGLKKTESEYLFDCSDIDELIVFKEDGKFIITKVSEKQFVGNVIYIDIFKRKDERTIYNLIYTDGKLGTSYAKRFAVGGISRDKEYDITQGKPGSKILHFSANKNGESEVVKVVLKPKPKLKKTNFEFDFGTLQIKGRNSLGNIVTKNPVKSVTLLRKGTSTLGDLEVWFDDSINRLNTEKHGYLLGNFSANDKIIAFYKEGYYKITGFDSSVHFDDNLIAIEKLKTNKPITVIYLDGEKNKYFIKRFLPIVSDKRVDFVFKEQNQTFVLLSTNYLPQIEVVCVDKDKKKSTETLSPDNYVEIGRIKNKGKKIAIDNIKNFNELEPLHYEEPEEEIVSEEMVDEEYLLPQKPDNDDNEDDSGFEDPGIQMSLDL